jgi:hypothetical protein
MKQMWTVAIAIALLTAEVCSACNPGEGGLAGGDPCAADVNSSGAVDADDLLAVILGWGPCSQPCPPACAADVNHTCLIDVDDLVAVILAWGPCPCSPVGVWSNNQPLQYTCGLGFVSFNIPQWTFTTTRTMLRVSGAPVLMTGPLASCIPGQSFSVTGFIAGSCQETYTLSGTFNSPTTFTATFTAAYSGNCCILGDCCTTQTFNLTATRVPE